MVAFGTGAERRLRGQAAERAVEQFAGGFRLDVADDADGQRVAGEHVAHIGLEVVRRDRRDRFRRAVRGLSVGVAGKRRRPPAAVYDVVRAGGGAAQIRQHLVAHQLDRLGVEARRRQREAQQLDCGIEICGERPQRAAEMIAPGHEAELDRLLLHALLERAGVELARPFVEQRDHHVGDTRLAGWVGVRAAEKRVVDRDHRHGLLAHQPGLDAARADDRLDLAGGRRRADECERNGGGE
jgi:hypothetical protein